MQCFIIYKRNVSFVFKNDDLWKNNGKENNKDYTGNKDTGYAKSKSVRVPLQEVLQLIEASSDEEDVSIQEFIPRGRPNCPPVAIFTEEQE